MESGQVNVKRKIVGLWYLNSDLLNIIQRTTKLVIHLEFYDPYFSLLLYE